MSESNQQGQSSGPKDNPTQETPKKETHPQTAFQKISQGLASCVDRRTGRD
jgi:hypothetical protein